MCADVCTCDRMRQTKRPEANAYTSAIMQWAVAVLGEKMNTDIEKKIPIIPTI